MHFNYLTFRQNRLYQDTVFSEVEDFGSTRERCIEKTNKAVTKALRHIRRKSSENPLSNKRNSNKNFGVPDNINNILQRTLSTLYPPGICAEFETPLSQWKEFSSYLKSFLLENPQLSENTKLLLLTFNAQYLVKIADYSPFEQQRDNRQVSPFRKTDLSYHREYSKDNALLAKAILPLKDIWPSAQILITANSCYEYFLKSSRNAIFLSCLYDVPTATTKIIDKLSEFNRNDYFNQQIHVHIEDASDSSKLRLLNFLVGKITQDFSFRVAGIIKIFFSVIYIETDQINIVVTDDPHFDSVIVRGGSTPSLSQSADCLVRLQNTSVEAFYDVATTNTSVTLDKILLFSDSSSQKKFNNLINLELLEKFETICIKTTKLKSIRILGQALLNLIKGLFDLEIETAFSLQGLQKLLVDSCKRINYFIEMMNTFNAVPLEFGNHFDFVIEEITFLLFVAKPYKLNDLESTLAHNLEGSWPTSQLIKMTQSGTQCFFDTVRTIVKINKELLREPCVLYFDDVYFELLNYLNNGRLKGYSVSSIHSLDNQFNVLPTKNIRINALFVDFHSSSQKNRKIQSSHDVIEIIDKLLALHVLQDNCVVTIDNTIGTWKSEEIEELLTYYQTAIADQTLHFVLTRSCHKLDIFGCDKLNAGMTLVFSHPGSLFLKKYQSLSSTVHPESLEYQVYTHFYKHAFSESIAYTNRIIKNSERLYQMIDSTLRFKSAKDSKKYGIARKDDKRSTYWEFPLNESVVNKALALFKQSPLFHDRNSFGYRETTKLLFEESGSTRFRITPGLEKKSDILAMSEFFNRYLPEWFEE